MNPSGSHAGKCGFIGTEGSERVTKDTTVLLFVSAVQNVIGGTALALLEGIFPQYPLDDFPENS